MVENGGGQEPDPADLNLFTLAKSITVEADVALGTALREDTKSSDVVCLDADEQGTLNLFSVYSLRALLFVLHESGHHVR